ncbi:MAG: tripartite tricarboxylate transporter substrate-binding protein [Proteobacteria bacterium]|nr:tripartite tricarboxylate transporter substrate-binding protein [Pseudomonadota bacterium]
MTKSLANLAVPTIAESGLAAYSATSWNGLAAPAKTRSILSLA